MTREQQITQASQGRFPEWGEQQHALELAFQAGCHWADTHPHWISVEDELPLKKSEYDALSNNVLATDGKEIYESVYNHDFEEWFTHDLWAIDNITHWMPKPAPPTCSEKPNNCKKGDWLEEQGKKLDPDKVIEWLKTKVYDDSTYGREMIEQFKKDLAI